MSEHLTHVSSYEDTVTLILQGEIAHPAFVEAVSRQYDSGLITAGARGNHLWVPGILKASRARWEREPFSDEDWMKLAGGVGWIAHRAADQVVKPVYAVVRDEVGPDAATENQVYHDAICYRHAYVEAGRRPASDIELIDGRTLEDGSLDFDLGPDARERCERLVSCHWTTEQAGLHRFTGDPGLGTEDWVTALLDGRQEYTEDLDAYVRAFGRPDPEKTRVYQEEQGFYDPGDDLIRRVRELQATGESGIGLAEARSRAAEQSLYARILRRALEYLECASGFYRFEVDDAGLVEGMRLDRVY